MADRKTIADVFSAIGAAGNVCLFLSQLPLMRTIVREGDSARFSWAPSITLVNTMTLWSAYTLFVIPTPQLFVGNWSGMIIPLFYLAVFWWYAKQRAARLRIAGAAISALAFGWGLSCGLFLGGVANPASILGGITTASNVTFFVSPLRQLVRAVREMDTKRVPVLLSVVQIGQSTVWMVVGIMLEDFFIILVNALGCGFAVLQCSILLYIVSANWLHARRAAGKAGAVDGAEGKPLPSALPAEPVHAVTPRDVPLLDDVGPVSPASSVDAVLAVPADSVPVDVSPSSVPAGAPPVVVSLNTLSTSNRPEELTPEVDLPAIESSPPEAQTVGSGI
jgi:uncharacterized protein with PQ loop repeat